MLGSMQWTSVETPKGVVPEPRLDFAFTTLRLKVNNPKYTPHSDDFVQTFDVSTLDVDDISNEDSSLIWRNYLFVHGGMNVSHDIFQDAYLCCLDDADDNVVA